MKVNRLGILQNHIVNHYPIGRVEVLKGSTKTNDITIYKEYIGNKLDLKFYLIKDKLGKLVKSRLLHIDNGKVIKKIDRLA